MEVIISFSKANLNDPFGVDCFYFNNAYNHDLIGTINANSKNQTFWKTEYDFSEDSSILEMVKKLNFTMEQVDEIAKMYKEYKYKLLKRTEQDNLIISKFKI